MEACYATVSSPLLPAPCAAVSLKAGKSASLRKRDDRGCRENMWGFSPILEYGEK